MDKRLLIFLKIIFFKQNQKWITCPVTGQDLIEGNRQFVFINSINAQSPVFTIVNIR